MTIAASLLDRRFVRAPEHEAYDDDHLAGGRVTIGFADRYGLHPTLLSSIP
jgi:hypothetical protein